MLKIPKIRTILIVPLPLIILTAFFFPFLTTFTSPEFRDRIYRSYTFKVIAEHVGGTESDPQILMEEYLDFIYNNLYTVRGEPVVYGGALNDLLRGIGWCDQQANAFTILCYYRGIKASLVMLKGDKNISRHTVARVLLNGKWKIVDPLNGVIFKDSSGRIASFTDIQKGKPGFRSRKHGDFKSSFFKKSYKSNFMERFPPVIWSWPGEFEDPKRAAIRRLIDIYHALFGEIYFSLYQDFYLNRVRELSVEKFDLKKPDVKTYFKARNYQLCGRFAKAVQLYSKISENYPESPYEERARLFKSACLLKMGKLNAAYADLDSFLSNKKKSSWAHVARQYLDWCKYRMGKTKSPASASDVSPDSYY